jgi:hypothetical protein
MITTFARSRDVQFTMIAVPSSRTLDERRRCLPSTTHFLKALIETMCCNAYYRK